MRTKNNEKMNKILCCVNKYYEENYCSPSLRLIENLTSISRQTVLRYLKYMHEMDMISYDGKNIVTEYIKNTLHNTRKGIAILGNVVCGDPFSEVEDNRGDICLPDCMMGDGEFYALYAYGDSMKDAGINEHDIVIVRRQESAKVGEIIVVLDEENCNTLKRLLHDGNRYYLHPENINYDDLYPSEIKIQGVAVKVIKNL